MIYTFSTSREFLALIGKSRDLQNKPRLSDFKGMDQNPALSVTIMFRPGALTPEANTR